MNAGDRDSLRSREDSARRANLHDAAVHENGDAVGKRHRFFLVVRDVHGGRAECPLQRMQLESRFHPQLGIEVRQRLVKQEQARLADDRARKRAALLLSAGELPGRALQQVPDADLRGGVGAPRARPPSHGVPTIFSGKPMFCATVMCG